MTHGVPRISHSAFCQRRRESVSSFISPRRAWIRRWLRTQSNTTSDNSGQFIPQATNLQALGGISFRKGCYTGQEMVARAKFRGANKRALWTLSGTASRVPEAGEDLELKMGDNWRRTGTVLAAVQLDDGQLLVQVVMNNDMEPDSIFRVRDDAGSLRIEPLPYSLEDV